MQEPPLLMRRLFCFKGISVSRVLYPSGSSGTGPPVGSPSFIWARDHSRARATYPPARTSSPRMPVYMVLQPAAGQPDMSPCPLVNSYLTFSPLLPVSRERSFSSPDPCPFGQLPLGSAVLCVARTFLTGLATGAMERSAGKLQN